MKIHFTSILIILLSTIFLSCTVKYADLSHENVDVLNREIISSSSNSSNELILNGKEGAGLAILKNLDFDTGTIELELKGEDNPGRSFIGLAFNIQNDSTYEAIYFRPFNFQSDEQIRREHSVQYINHPKQDWRYLRTNFAGQYEAEFPRKPSPENWFSIKIKIDQNTVSVYDQNSKTELLSVTRLGKQVSDKIGLWTGHNSKGEFRNLKIYNTAQ